MRAKGNTDRRLLPFSSRSYLTVLHIGLHSSYFNESIAGDRTDHSDEISDVLSLAGPSFPFSSPMRPSFALQA